MKRFITDDLIKWKNNINRKPLIIRGARQVGKTYIVKQFGNDYYDDIAYFNFDHDEGLRNLFVHTKDPKRILEQLTFIYGKAIKPDKTLIFFDEIQECSNALNSLKYFQEEASEYEGALNWLNDADLLYKVYNVSPPKLPLKAYENLSSFKIYFNDVGLLRKMSNLDSIIIKEGNELYEEFKGSLTENFILNQLISVFEQVPNYYTFDRYEVDFIIQKYNDVIPVEVKSGLSTNNKSLTKFGEQENSKTMIRFSMNNLIKDGNILNIPLFMVEYAEQLLKLV